MMAPNVLEDCTPLYVRRLSLYYLTSAMIVTTDNRTMMITQVTRNNGALMNADNYQISTLPYIENASNKIMEKYKIKAQYETEPPHGDAIYSIINKRNICIPFL